MEIVPEAYEGECCVEGEGGKHFPYGTSLSFADDLADEVGFDNLSLGDVVEVRALAFVKRKMTSEESEKGESEGGDMEESTKRIELQLTSADVLPQSPDRATQMYGKGG